MKISKLILPATAILCTCMIATASNIGQSAGHNASGAGPATSLARQIDPVVDPLSALAAFNAIREVPDLVDQGLAWLDHFQNLEQMMRRVWKGGLWPLWCVVYEDGTVVYNKFRASRSMREVVEYFTGRSPRPDCDAWLADGTKVCYGPQDVRQLRHRHGEIVNIACLEQ